MVPSRNVFLNAEEELTDELTLYGSTVFTGRIAATPRGATWIFREGNRTRGADEFVAGRDVDIPRGQPNARSGRVRGARAAGYRAGDVDELGVKLGLAAFHAPEAPEGGVDVEARAVPKLHGAFEV